MISSDFLKTSVVFVIPAGETHKNLSFTDTTFIDRNMIKIEICKTEDFL